MAWIKDPVRRVLPPDGGLMSESEIEEFANQTAYEIAVHTGPRPALEDGI